MNEFPRWKYVLVVVVLLLGVLYGVPNLYVQQPAVQINANRGATIDEALKERVQGVLEKQKISFESIESGDGHMLVRLPIGETDSSHSSSLAAADALIVQPEDSDVIAAGEIVEVIPLSWG